MPQAVILAHDLRPKDQSSPSEAGKHDTGFLIPQLGDRLRHPDKRDLERLEVICKIDYLVVPPKCAAYTGING